MPHKKPFFSFFKKDKLFYPSKQLARQAHIPDFETYRKLYELSIKKPATFWAEAARDLHWHKKWNKVLEWKQPFAKWFAGGKINCSYNCLDRHLPQNNEKPAIIWESETGEEKQLSYGELYDQVCRLGSFLKDCDVKKGDRVIIYLPMIPEAAVAMLACTRIGAVHSVVFSGYSSGALKTRIEDSQPKIIITADSGFRKGEATIIKNNVDEALSSNQSVQKVIVVKYGNETIKMKRLRDIWYDSALKKSSLDCPAIAMNSEDPLFILYTSGTTGKPKGVVHTHGGYLTQVALSAKYIFDIHPNDILWCTADVGWITGHSYAIYGPLLNGITTVMIDGLPTHPTPDKPWKIIDKYKITQFYTAPTAIRVFMKLGENLPLKYKLNSLKVIGTVGEPIGKSAWLWYYNNIGRKRCPIVDTWWQTETGSVLISALPGATPLKPGSATLPFFGVDAEVVNADGKTTHADESGFLVIKKPWPSMLSTVYKNPARYKKSYWGEIKNVYFSGDGAKRDKDGYFWITGRTDDVIKSAGHRLGTMEIENAITSHKSVAEAAVVGKTDELKGEAVVAFVTLKKDFQPSSAISTEIKKAVTVKIGAIARPSEVYFVENLPKTRSGKIIRRILKQTASGESLTGDTSTLADESVLENLKELKPL